MKTLSENRHILYAPGRGCDLSVLTDFRKELALRGFVLHLLPFSCDEGEFRAAELMAKIPPECSWWIGISLGASVLWQLSALPDAMPQRLTVINPFADRERLAKEKGFSLRGQWIFKPLDYCPRAGHIDVVISLHDQSIGAHHGLELLSAAQPAVKNLIIVKADHQINDSAAQRQLAGLLADTGETGHEAGEHCDVYSWTGGF